jgi:hypothetical protein
MPANRQQIEELVATVPNFRNRWEVFLRESKDEEEPLWFNGMGELAHYIVESYDHGVTVEFPNLFACIEAFLPNQDADPELVTLIAVGLFESMQNIASHRKFGIAPFRQWLGPRSLFVWDAADAFAKREAGRAARNKPRWWQFWRRRGFDAERALAEVESPELKKVIEATYRKTW